MARITEIEAHDIYPEYHDFNGLYLARTHGRQIQGRTIFIVRTDAGVEGLGDQWGPAGNVEDLRQRYVGTDPFDWLNGQLDLPINMAIYDLIGKMLDVPVWKLVGPKVRSWVPVAAWTVSRPPADMAEEVRQAAARGYRWIKYHLDQVQNVLDQTAAMQEVAPEGFRVHYDFNANLPFYTICPILLELERFPVAGRIEDPMDPGDEDGYRLLKEKCKLPMITHHGPAEFMVRRTCDGYMSGHAPVGMAAKLAAVAEMTRTPLMLQNAGGTINQAFLAHQAAVFPMATIDHVDLCHLWKEDVTVEAMPVVGGSVQVPEGPGLGVTLDRGQLEKCAARQPLDRGRFLVRMRHADGTTVYVRHDADQPGCADSMRQLDRLTGYRAPAVVPSYAAAVKTDYWEGEDDQEAFERWWGATEEGPAWEGGTGR